VHNNAGDDICVVMCGYEDQIRQMLLDQNQGLQRRFPLASAFMFEDFTNDELRLIMVSARVVVAAVATRPFAHGSPLFQSTTLATCKLDKRPRPFNIPPLLRQVRSTLYSPPHTPTPLIVPV